MTDSAVAEKLREGRLRAAERQTVRDALRKIMVDAEDNGELDGFERGDEWVWETWPFLARREWQSEFVRKGKSSRGA